MGSPAILVLTFNTSATIGSVITIQEDQGQNLFSSQAASIRTSGKFAVGTSDIQSAEGYAYAINADFAGTIVASVVLQKVTIIGSRNQFGFENFSFPSYITFDENTDYTPNVPDAPVFSVAVTLGTAPSVVDPNLNCLTSLIPTNGTPSYTVFSPVQQVFPSTPIFFQVARQGGNRVYDIKDASEVRLVGNIPTVDLFVIDTVTVVEGAQGATASININVTIGDVNSVRQFSIDGTEYQASAQFTGMAAGTYTAYVKDNFAALITQEFEVQGGVLPYKPEPFFNIPIANPLRYVPNVAVEFPNWDNALFETIQRSGYFPNTEHRCTIV